MAENRPLFDDEWLPKWLTDAGITYAGPSAASLAQPRPQTGGLTAPDPFASATAVPGRTGVTGRLTGLPAVPRWMEQAPTLEQEIISHTPGWMQRGSPQIVDPATLPLPAWMSRTVESAAPPSEPDLGALPLPDLDIFGPPASTPPSKPFQEDVTPKYSAATLAPLPWTPGVSNPLDQSVPITMTDSSWLSESSNPAKPPEKNPAGDTVSGTGGLTSRFKPPTGDLSGQAPPSPPAAPNQTYEEWEHSQSEPERAAQQQVEQDLFGAVPDWLAESTPSADVPASAAAPEFMPDWFAGLEEQSRNATPDWFNPAEIANTPLTGPIDTNPPPDAQAKATPPPADLPDWMKGDSGDLAGLDFDALLAGNANPSANEPNAPVISEPAGADSGSPIDALALDWMSDVPDLPGFSIEPSPVVPTSPVTPSQPPADQSAPPADIPAWMRELNPDEAATANDAVPDWLSDIPRVADQAPVAPTQAEVPAADLPEWLAGMQPGVSNQAPAEPEPVPENASGQFTPAKNVSSADIDALMSLPVVSHVEPDPLPSPSAPLDVSSLSLEESDLDNILGPMPAAPEPAPVEAGPKVPPSRKTGLYRAVETRAANAPKTPAEPEIAPARPAAALPEYVADMRPSDVPVQFKIAGAVEIGVEEAPLSQLTDQLRQLRDHALAFKPPAPPPTASAGPLADLAGPLAVEPVIVRAATGASPSAISAAGGATDAQLRRVDVIRRLLEIEGTDAAAADKTKASARPAVRINLERLIITLILLALLIAPFFTHALNLVTPPNLSAPNPAQSAVFSAMDSITSGQPVLVAFEYGPTGAGELDDLARDLLRDLFKHGAKPVIVSTDFAGAMHAESLLLTFGHNANELQALNRTADKPLLARTDYVVLRYLPSGAAGVRAVLEAIYHGGFEAQTEFTADVEGQPSGLNLQTDLAALQSAPVVVIAETPEDVRNWAEQYRTPSDVTASQARILLATSAAADATARTYSAALPQTIIGPLVGLRDATIYQALRQPPTTPTASDQLLQRWQSVGLGAWAAAALILFGALFGLLRSLRRREARR